MDNNILQVSMDVILHSGQGLNYTDQALQKAVQFEFEAAFDLLDQARKASLAAHQAQTQMLQSEMIEAEVSGEQMDYPLLFIHAQDMLMRLQSEINMASHMIELAQAILDAKANP